MPTYSLMPQPKIQFFGVNGLPLSGGHLYTYYPGTTVPKSTYTSANGSTFNTNPVILDSQGRGNIWFDGAYDVELWSGDKTVSGSTLILTQNNVSVASTPSTIDATQYFVGFNKITVSDIAPTNPGQNDLWVDTSV